MESPDQPLESKSQRDIYNSISLHVECLQNTHQAIDSIIETVGEFNIKLAIKILADKMLTEPTTDRISTLLLGLAGRYFNNVMYMLQTHIRKDCPHPMVFRTLGNLASHYALKCIPFLSLTFVYIRVMLKLAMINDIKEDVCYAMENFATAINYYYKHWEECSFPREAESQLCSPMIPIYQHLVYHWLNDKELAVKEASMKALWPMLGVLVRHREQQDEIIQRIPQMLKDSRILSPLLVAKRLHLFLDACNECKPSVPKKIFQAICDYVFHQILPFDISTNLKKGQKVDRFTHQDKNEKTTVQRQLEEEDPTIWEKPWFRYPDISREHRDLLTDAFSYLVCCCPADALDFLQKQLMNNTEYLRVAIVKHLKAVISSDILSKTENAKRPIVEAMKCVLDDHREAVRKAILGFIKELLRSSNVEGCAVWEMVVYVFEQFTVPACQSQGKELTSLQKEKERECEEAIQRICIDILEHLNTSAEGMRKALWPKLLHFVVPAPYTPTLTPLCRCLKDLATIRQDDEKLFLGSCRGVKLPSAQELVARLLVLAANPNQRGNWALQLLHALRSNIHPAVRNLWGIQIPFLWESIQGNAETSSHEWGQTLLQFLRRSLETISDSLWTQNLSRELEAQMTSYSSQSVEKSFLYKSLGTLLSSCEDVVFVRRRIQHYIESANYMEAPEREKVVQILSFSAIGHLDLTLASLHEFGGGTHMKTKTSNIINRFKDYTQGRRGHVHQTMLLTYGGVALYAPKELLLSSVDDIMNRILLHYRKSCQVLGVNFANKDLNLKLALIQSTTDICCAIRKTRNFQNFQFTCRKELLPILLNFIREEPLDSLTTPVRGKAITAIAFLCKLKPTLKVEEIRDLLDQSLKSLFPLPPLEKLKEKGETEWAAAHIEALYTDAMDALGELTKSIVEEHPTPEVMDEMFQLIDPWFTVTECSEERALQASFQALAAFQDNFHLPEGEHFPQFGSRMAFLAPYTCDVSPRCRQWAAQCITCLMRIEAQSRVTSWEEEELLSASKDLQSDVPSSRFKASSRMAKVVSAHFPTDQALDFIEVILEDMVSGNEMCATAAGHWLLTLLQDCGGAMKAQISNILDTFYSRLPTIKQEDLRQVLVDAVSIMAHYHLDAVFSSLLCRRLPMDSETGELWRSLGRDPSVASLVLHELASKIQMQPSAPENSLPSDTEESVEFADEEPLKATCAIYEVISTLPSKEVVHKLYPELFCALLGQASRTLGQQMPVQEGRRKLFLRDQQVSEGNPYRLSVASLKALLLKMTCDRPLAQIRAGTIWALLRDRSTHHEGVCLLTRALYESGLLYHSVIHNILPWMESSSEKLRLTGTAFFTEAIWDPSMGERKQLKKVLPIVIERAGDQHHNIRRMAIRGLGNILLVAPDKAQRCFSCDRAAKEQRKSIITILVGALYDAKVVLESLKVLALIFRYLKGKDVGSLFKDISIKTVSYLDDDDPELRNAAFNLFGVLASWTKFRYKTFFADLVKRSLVPLLIHLQDPCPLVSETCRSALLKAARFFLKRRLRTHIEELHRTTNLNFPNLHVHICRQLVNTNPEVREDLLRKLSAYHHSRWEELRRAALELSGAILENIHVTDLHEISQEQLLTCVEGPRVAGHGAGAQQSPHTEGRASKQAAALKEQKDVTEGAGIKKPQL